MRLGLARRMSPGGIASERHDELRACPFSDPGGDLKSAAKQLSSFSKVREPEPSLLNCRAAFFSYIETRSIIRYDGLEVLMPSLQHQPRLLGLRVFEYVEEQFMDRLIGDGQYLFIQHDWLRVALDYNGQASTLHSIYNP